MKFTSLRSLMSRQLSVTTLVVSCIAVVLVIQMVRYCEYRYHVYLLPTSELRVTLTRDSSSHDHAPRLTRVTSDIWPRIEFRGCYNLTFRIPEVVVSQPGNHRQRILCWILTTPEALLTRAYVVHVLWASDCDVTLYMTHRPDTGVEPEELPRHVLESMTIMELDVGNGREKLTEKYELAWRHVYQHYGNSVDWYVKADDDTFIWVDHLRDYLHERDPTAPEYYGHVYCEPYQGILFNTGGGGYVLSAQNVKALLTAYDTHSDCHQPGHGADWKDAKCLFRVGILPADTRDALGRERFLPLPIKNHILGESYVGMLRYWEINDNILGDECCSDQIISVHALSAGDMMAMKFLIRIQHSQTTTTGRNISDTSSGSSSWLPLIGRSNSWSRLWYHYNRIGKNTS